ncbi:hypothetical protein [Streptomyces sp. SP18BB07]|uniref:hypothetical protein n=1 Tax=Streptomyces sp. SP18BB07 TaxID=3002522 RepID=UPI003FCE115F
MDTPGVREVLAATALQAQGYLSGPTAAPLTVVTQCAGGRHRAAFPDFRPRRRRLHPLPQLSRLAAVVWPGVQKPACRKPGGPVCQRGAGRNGLEGQPVSAWSGSAHGEPLSRPT